MKKTKHVVFDTNSLISAFLIKSSLCALALDRVIATGRLASSTSCLHEFSEVIFRAKFDSYFKLDAEERINNRPCYKIIIDNKDFAYENYTVGENESITSIARKLRISEYMILEVNPKFNDYFDILKKGQIIKVPNAYAKYVTLYIDQLYFLPISIKILDDKGLYEQYDYHKY